MFGHNSFVWTPVKVFNAGTYADENYTGEHLIIKGQGAGVAAFYQDGTRFWTGTYTDTGDGRIGAIASLAAALPDGTYYKIEEGTGLLTTEYEEHLAAIAEAERLAALANANGDSNGDSNGDLDPEPCDDANRETNADGSCASSCKTSYDFDSSSADAKCVLVDIEKGTKWPLIVGGIAVLGIGAYFAFNK